MKIRSALFLSFSVILLGLLSSFADAQIEPGYRREDVFRIMGSPEFSAKIGKTETMSFKNGTKLVLSNGVVQEVSVPGQVRIGNAVKVLEVARPAPAPAPVPQPAPAPIAESKPAVAAKESSSATNGVETAAAVKPVATAASVAKTRPTAVQTQAEVGAIARIQRLIAGFFLVFVLVSVVMFVFNSFCFKLICEKAGKPGGALVWIPIAQFIPLLRVAGMREWMLALLLIPFVNIAFAFVMWAKICIARGKSPWLVLALLVPVANLCFIPYLAFSGGAVSPDAGVEPTNDMNEAPVDEEMAAEAPVDENFTAAPEYDEAALASSSTEELPVSSEMANEAFETPPEDDMRTGQAASA